MQTPIYYAPPVRWYRTYRFQRSILRLLILASILCGLIWSFRLAQQVSFLFQQRRSMRYTMPADRIVLAAGTADVPKLLAGQAYHTVGSVFYPTNIAPAAAHNPPRDVPLYWSQNETYVFLHSLKRPGHHPRLVSVVVGLQPPFQPGMGYDLTAMAMIPANLWLGSRPIPCGDFIASGGLHVGFTSSLCFFAGQADTADESHFTIAYQLDGKPNIIDGWLTANDAIKLEPRK